MATQEVHIKNAIGAAILSFRSSSYSPTAINNIEPASATVVDLSLGLTSGVAAGSAMNSDQIDLGTTRAPSYSVLAAIEWCRAPLKARDDSPGQDQCIVEISIGND